MVQAVFHRDSQQIQVPGAQRFSHQHGAADVEDGVLVTPPVYDAVLKGITRQSLMEIAEEMGIPVKERTLLRDELYTADEVFLTGTAAEITPVVNIDQRKISKGPGPITKELRNAFFNVVEGRDERYLKWLDFVNE